jgi:hypothetical protein
MRPTVTGCVAWSAGSFRSSCATRCAIRSMCSGVISAAARRVLPHALGAGTVALVCWGCGVIDSVRTLV